jgi:PAS domain S-box-containing protein
MTYSQIHLWCQAVKEAGTLNFKDVSARLHGQRLHSPAGLLEVMANNHILKSAFIGEQIEGKKFRIIWKSPRRVKPEPWLGIENTHLPSSRLIQEALNQYTSLIQVNVELEDTEKKAEDALADSRTLLDAIVESTGDMIWAIEADSLAIMSFNRSYYNYMLQYRGIRLEKGMRPEDLFPTEDYIKLWRDLYQRTLAEGSFSTEYKAYTGNTIFLLNLHVLKRNGTVFGISVFGKDITERKKMENALKDSEEKYRVLVENAGEAVVVAQDERIKYVNPRAKQIMGYSYEELLAMPFAQLIHPDDRKTVEKRYVERLHGQSPPGNYSFRVVCKTGEILWVEINTALITWENKPATLNFLTDVTERKIAEEALQQSEVKYRTLFNAAKDGILLIDNDGFTDCNSRAMEMFGGTKEQLIGKQPFELSPEFQPDGLNSKVKTIELVKLVYKGRPQFFEWRHKRFDGTEFDAEVSLNLIDVTGHKYLLAIIRDITERKQAEETLRLKEHEIIESEEKFRTLFIAGSDAFTVSTIEDGRITEINKSYENMFGFSRDEVIGKTSKELNIWPDFSIREKMINDLNKYGQANAETVLRKKNGEIFDCIITMKPLQLQNNQYMVGTIHDISERKRAYESEEEARTARLASQAKSEFLAGMSHELRTPLNAVIGFSQVLQKQYFGKLNEQQQEYVNDIYTSGQHLLSLINDILDLSKIETGKMELELTQVNMESLIKNSLVMIKEKAHDHQIELNVQTVPNMEIQGDERKIRQVVYNLLSNAIKFTPDGGKISVTAEYLDKDTISVCVADNGIGVAPENQEKLFKEFSQIKSGLVDKSPGTGLGLALCKRMVELHGGRIWMASEGRDKGSRFCFTLPLQIKNKSSEVS